MPSACSWPTSSALTTTIDSEAQAPGQALADLGGADLIVSTAPTTEPVAELLRGLRVHGQLTLVGVDGGSIDVPAGQLVMNGQALTGHIEGAIRAGMHAARSIATAHG